MNGKHPEAIFIQLHTYCNASCINCPHPFTYKTIHPKGRMNDSTWIKILNDLIQMDYQGQVGFYLHHEPLLDNSLFDKIKDINTKTNAYVVLSTNGAMLNKINIEKLIEARPRKVHININSGDKEEFHSSMGLDYQTTFSNIQNFIAQAKNFINIEINCPVMKGYNVDSLKQIFPNTYVNLEYNANSRGGLIPELIDNVKNSRFKLGDYCKQPSQNFNILHDGSVIACCMDWMHESKKDFDNINSSSISEIYNNNVKSLQKEFRDGNYGRYNMCQVCSEEMGFKHKINNQSDYRFKILLSNHQLLHNSGSEIYTVVLANYLKQNNCEVIVYSKYLGVLKDNFKQLGIKVVDNLEKIKNIKFDIAHVHHNINAIEIRNFFPDLPIIFLSQGVLPFLEQPPMFEINISHFFAISEEIKVNLVSKGIDEKQITTIGNIVDPNTFFPAGKINNTPSRALIISAKISDEKATIIKAACDTLKIEYTFIGGRFGEVSQNEVNQLIQQADIVFSLGRGIIESMFCERIPIVFDYAGGDGMVTPKNFDEIRKNNFSGRRFAKNFTVEELVEVIKKYNPDEAPILREKASEIYSAPNVVKQLLSAYKSAIGSFGPNYNPEIEKQLGNFYSTVQETRDYTKKTAIINFKKKLNIPPTDFNKLLNISEKLIGEGQLLEASEILQMLNKTGFNEDVLINLAVIEIMIQNYSDAYTLLNKVLQINPQNEVALENLLYLKQNSETYNNLHA